jgi:hypothetical protein
VTGKNTPKRARSFQLSSSRDGEHDLALDVPTGGSLVGFSSIRKRKGAIYGDANCTRIK